MLHREVLFCKFHLLLMQYLRLKPGIRQHATPLNSLPDPDSAVCAATEDAGSTVYKGCDCASVTNQRLNTDMCLLDAQLDIPDFDAGIC
jgi:hypothetical protein